MHVQEESLVESSKLGRAKEADIVPFICLHETLFGMDAADVVLQSCHGDNWSSFVLLKPLHVLQILLQADDAMLVLLVSPECLAVPSDHYGISVMCLLLRGIASVMCVCTCVCAQPAYIMLRRKFAVLYRSQDIFLCTCVFIIDSTLIVMLQHVTSVDV